MPRISLWVLVLCFASSAGAESHREKWRSVAGRLVTTDPVSYDYDWGQGVQMRGLLLAHERTQDARYLDFVRHWADHHLTKGVQVLMGNQPDSPRKGFCGRWIGGGVFLSLYRATQEPRYLKAARDIAHFIRAGATRSPRGVPGHWQGNYQIWVDTFYMTTPLLAPLFTVDGNVFWIEDIANQLLAAAEVMRNPRTGLWVHAWDWEMEEPLGVDWGRGNGWVTMALADALEVLPKGHRFHRPLVELAKSHADSLLAVQDRQGVWHTVLSDRQSAAECSATTMNIYGLLKLVRLGILPPPYRAAAEKAWNAVNDRWVRDGLVSGVSAGTVPTGKAGYLARALGTYWWGTGSYLMAGSEVDRLQ